VYIQKIEFVNIETCILMVSKILKICFLFPRKVKNAILLRLFTAYPALDGMTSKTPSGMEYFLLFFLYKVMYQVDGFPKKQRNWNVLPRVFDVYLVTFFSIEVIRF
jgi:hypothetical protein